MAVQDQNASQHMDVYRKLDVYPTSSTSRTVCLLCIQPQTQNGVLPVDYCQICQDTLAGYLSYQIPAQAVRTTRSLRLDSSCHLGNVQYRKPPVLLATLSGLSWKTAALQAVPPICTGIAILQCGEA